MTRPVDYPYSGILLSEVAGPGGRSTVTVKCDRCAHRRTFAVADLMAEHGDRVMPDLLGQITARCPKRQEVGVSYPRCNAVYADPVTADELARIKAARPPEPTREPRHRRWR